MKRTSAVVAIIISLIACLVSSVNAFGQLPGIDFKIYLPIVSRSQPPNAPVLNGIDNADQDNSYTVSWQSTDLADSYILEEATDAAFSNAVTVYQGSNLLAWSVMSPGKTPQTYYYRVKANNTFGDSAPSNVQSVVIYPLFIGLALRWDSTGYIRFTDESYDVGEHTERSLDILSDVDIIRSNSHQWYDPNPQGWESNDWYSFYSISTGQWRSSSEAGDPDWKWNCYWIVPYNQGFSNGQTISIDNQAFISSGPYTGVTAFGKTVQYWELINKNKFLYYDNGGNWKQYVNHGDIKLRYDAGNTRLLLFSDILRTFYYKGKRTSNTVRYIENLTVSNSFPSVVQVLTDQAQTASTVSFVELPDNGKGRTRPINSLEPSRQQ